MYKNLVEIQYKFYHTPLRQRTVIRYYEGIPDGDLRKMQSDSESYHWKTELWWRWKMTSAMEEYRVSESG